MSTMHDVMMAERGPARDYLKAWREDFCAGLAAYRPPKSLWDRLLNDKRRRKYHASYFAGKTICEWVTEMIGEDVQLNSRQGWAVYQCLMYAMARIRKLPEDEDWGILAREQSLLIATYINSLQR